MAVPEEIRKVPRPNNTVVVENKDEGPKHYAVRQRNGSVYIHGKNPQPINGKVIGHIYDGKFIPIEETPATNGPSAVSYGSSALVIRESKDYLDDLMDCMDIDYAVTTYVISLLKIVKPGIKSKRMSTEYMRTYIGQRFPGLRISSNSMTDLYRRLGMDANIRREFAGKRLARVTEDNHIIIDGMLKQDNSSVNNLSGFTYKTRIKGIKDISIVYAYDLERREILCSEVFPGGYVDSAAYSRFVRDNNITKGILVTDKGFPPSMLESELEERSELHFLTPLKRNDVRIDNNHMMEFEGVLDNVEGKVLYKKARIKGGRYLYSFRDSKKASIEEMAYLERLSKNGKVFDNSVFSEKKEDFGTIVFLSDVDLTPEQAYVCYSDRWLIELVFRFFKNDLDIHSTDAQDDFTVIGEEFVNTISSGITCRLMNLFRDRELLKEMSFGDIMDDLSVVWRSTDAPDSLPDREDRYWEHPFEYALDTMVRLELCTGGVKVRKPKAKTKDLEPAGTSTSAPADQPKRPRGRPRKNPMEPEQSKRPRGRPRKNPPVEDKPKRPRGRPRKNPL
ncbi:MAG: transposase [Candidatus Methanomethylophilaceae archaeon]|nr:transposase [Candidatus Methanomethylophilaceae archaeon]